MQIPNWQDCVARLINENLQTVTGRVFLNIVYSLIRFCIPYKSIVISTEPAALTLCSLVGISLVCTGCSYCQKYRTGYATLYSLVGISPICTVCRYCAEQNLLTGCRLIRVSFP